MMMRLAFPLAFAASALASPLFAQGAPDPVEQGREVAEIWCANCHAVVPDQGSALDAAPAFATLADDPLRTEAGLAAWIANPHPPMPDPGLSRDQIEAVVAYIRSLGD